MGLHLGWIPNEPGLRAREYAAPAPGVPDPDSPEAAAVRAAHAARALWTRLLIVVGLLALALFGLVGAVSHRSWFWGVGAALAVCCWLPLLEFAVRRRRVATRLRREKEDRAVRHAADLEDYQRGKDAWQSSEAERIAAAPRWLQVAAHEDITRLDVFGGTPSGRQNLLDGVGRTLLAERAVIVLDLSQDRVGDGLIAAARQAGISCQDYQLPRDLAATPLLAGLTGDEIASLIVEVLHADDANATAAGRATDLMILRKVTRALGGEVTVSRLHEALSLLLADATHATHATNAPYDDRAMNLAPHLSAAEQAGLHGLFGAGMRGEIGGNLIRLAAVLEPLAELGAGADANAGSAAPRPPARLTCLSLPDGPRDVAADLAAALIVQWATRSVADEDGFRPAIVLAGADEQSTRHLAAHHGLRAVRGPAGADVLPADRGVVASPGQQAHRVHAAGHAPGGAARGRAHRPGAEVRRRAFFAPAEREPVADQDHNRVDHAHHRPRRGRGDHAHDRDHHRPDVLRGAGAAGR